MALEQATKALRGEWRYSPTLSLTSALAVGGQRHAPADIPLGKTRNPSYRRLGGPQDRSGQAQKISPPTGIRSPARNESLYRLSHPGRQKGYIIQT